jgi:hypothetical protein
LDAQCIASKMTALHIGCLLEFFHPPCGVHGQASEACVV